MDPKSRSVKIHQGEMESLLNLKSILDHKEAVSGYVEKYLKFGWELLALQPQDGVDLEVDFGGKPEIWVKRLWQPGLSGAKINLGVRTGRRSGVIVLEVVKGPGQAFLDRQGPWRAQCVAALGAGRERHFYAWGPDACFDAACCWETPDLRWFGEGQVVPVPPSFAPEMQEYWRWLCPPWEKPPQSPSQALLDLFQQPLRREPRGQPEINFSWQEMYCLASPHEPLLQALSASYPSMQDYYQGILAAAVTVGITDPEVLLSLLWHGPRVNARQHPEIWDYLRQLAAEAPNLPGATPPSENVPWDLFVDDALALVRETSAAGSGQAADKAGPPCSLRRRPARPDKPGAATRTPFSCRQIRGHLRKV
jgi:hypothetical protein